MNVLFTEDVMSPQNFVALVRADIVILTGGNPENWYVYKNKVTGIKGHFTHGEVLNLIKEALNA